VIEEINPSADGKWLYYTSGVGGHANLYRQRLPVGDPEQITSTPSDDLFPAPSPDGREVAFHSWRSGSRDVYVMPLDGGPLQQVTSSPRQEAQPRWSPDGKSLTLTMFATGGVWVVRRDANGVWGKPVSRSATGSWPVWSPDGRWIAFTSYFLGGSLMVVGPDSGAPRVVLDSTTSDRLRVEAVAWSADGSTLYFKSHDVKGNASFWSIPAAGGRPTLLTRFDDPARPSYRPEWSVGSGHMYFSIDDRQSNVWVMEATPR
jgi:TolB protein